jgi:putative transposase
VVILISCKPWRRRCWQILMEADVEGLIGAAADRLNYRYGYRERSLDTRLGSLRLRIPKLRQGSSSALPGAARDRRKGAATVIQESLVRRRVDQLVHAMGLNGIWKSQVSKLCKSLPPRRRRTSTSG